jgi:YVTN family beta-propeller protein
MPTLPRSLATLLAALPAALLLGGLPSAAAAGGLLLVANKGSKSLSVVDPEAMREIGSVSEDGFTGHEVAASPDGRRAFVPIYGTGVVGQPGTDGHTIDVIDIAGRSVVASIDLGKPLRPHRPVFGPRDGLLYVTTELGGSVTVIDPGTLRVVGEIPTGQVQSHMLVISGDGRRGYTANVKSGSVSVLDLEARTLLAVVPVSASVQRISLSTDGRWAFTADQIRLRIAVIDTSKFVVANSVPLPGVGFGTTPTPDGRSLLVTVPALNRVCQVDLETLRVARYLDVPRAPQEILVRPDGAVAYVSCDFSRQVAVIDLKAWKVAGLIPVGANDDGLAWAAGN